MSESKDVQISASRKLEAGSSDPALLIRIGWTSRWQSRRQSVAYSQRAKSLLTGKAGKKAGKHRALADVTLSWQAKWRGEFDDALQYAIGAEQCLSEVGFPSQRAELYSIMGVVHYSRHRLDLADGAVQRGLSLVGPDTDKDAFVDLLSTCATIHRHSGNLRQAGEVLGKARLLASGAMLARIEHNIARWMHADGAPEHALAHAETAIKLAVEHQNNVILPYAHEIAGACLVDLDELDRAVTHFTKALEIATRDDDSRAQCQIIGWFAGLEKTRLNARATYIVSEQRSPSVWTTRYGKNRSPDALQMSTRSLAT